MRLESCWEKILLKKQMNMLRLKETVDGLVKANVDRWHDVCAEER